MRDFGMGRVERCNHAGWRDSDALPSVFRDFKELEVGELLFQRHQLRAGAVSHQLLGHGQGNQGLLQPHHSTLRLLLYHKQWWV